MGCRTLTGAWIETYLELAQVFDQQSHPHGCVD